MSAFHDIADAIRQLRDAFETAGLELPVSIEVAPETFQRLLAMAGEDLELFQTEDEDARPVGPEYMMLVGQRIDECLF